MPLSLFSWLSWRAIRIFTAALGSAAYETLSEAILEDIWQLQATRIEGCDLTNLLYLQFEAALGPFRSAINRGEFGLAHDWIANGPR